MRVDILNFGSSNSVVCDICQGYVIGARFTCLNCLLEYDGDSIDFCVRCYWEDFKSDKVVHTGYHPLLQLRRCLATCCLFSVAHSSRAALEKARARLRDPSGPPQCAICKQSVTLPCWLCVDCKGKALKYTLNNAYIATDEFFLCLECNAKDNATEPWMMDKHLNPEEEHTYVHKLVLCPEPTPPEPVVPLKRLCACKLEMQRRRRH